MSKTNIFGSLSSLGDVVSDIQTMEELTTSELQFENLLRHTIEFIFTKSSNESAFEEQFEISTEEPLSFNKTFGVPAGESLISNIVHKYFFLTSRITMQAAEEHQNVTIDPLNLLESYSLKTKHVHLVFSVKLTQTKEEKVCDIDMGKIVGVPNQYLKDLMANHIKFYLFNLKTDDIVECLGINDDRKASRFSGFNYVQSRLNPMSDMTEFTISIFFKPEDENLNGPLLSTLSNKSGIKMTWFETALYDLKGNKIEPKKEEEEIDMNLLKDAFIRHLWNHKVVTFDGSCVKVYLNNQLINQMAAHRIPIGDGKKMTIGAMTDGLDYEGYRGDIGQVKIFNYVVPEKDISKLIDM